MVKQPVAIVIARHGARLDAADKSWHLSSPTPYDPPLTYGGWNQSRALGLRISGLLQTLVEERERKARSREDSPNNGETKKSRRKKLKVFIHSSPFQRCLQTSIGISAGMSQFRGKAAERERSVSRSRSAKELGRPSPRLHAVDTTAEEVAARSSARNALRDSARDTKTTLRVDAFLGEWLSPEYFDLITPPPASQLMIAGAKAELMSRGDEVKSHTSTPGHGHLKKGSHGNLWSSAMASESAPTLHSHNSNGPLDMRQLLHSLPARNRTSSYGSGRAGAFARPALPSRLGERSTSAGYVPPVPAYAVSPGEPIPAGYVAHARNACVDYDMHWDSMREPLEWGDGGEYGEEWSAMHKRFRKGLGHMIEWYGQHGTANVSDDDEAVPASGTEEDDDAEDDEDIAVVLVTHSAGCNALIGALTEQPVLVDVGMASVTMAVAKPENDQTNGHNHLSPVQSPTPESSPELSSVPGRRSSPRPAGLSNKFEMKVVASVDHLRPGVDPAYPNSQSGSPVMAASKTIPESRRRSTLTYAPSDSAWTLDDSRRTVSSALGSIRRLSTTQNVVAPQRIGSSSSAVSSTGLWSPVSPTLPPTSQPDFSEKIKEKLENVNAQLSSNTPALDNKLGITLNVTSDVQPAADATIQAHNHELNAAASVPSINTIAPSPHKEAFDTVTELSNQQKSVGVGRTLSQKGLWGSAGLPSVPKRRWTLQQD